MLDHPWLKMPSIYEYRMNEEEYETMMNDVKEKE
jgi:hypothetical protein